MPSLAEWTELEAQHLLSGLNWRRSPQGDLPGGGLRPDWLVPLLSLLLGLSRLDLSCNSSDSACPSESLELPVFLRASVFIPVRRRFRFSEPVTVPYGSFPVQFRPTLSRKVSCSAAAEWYLILVDFSTLFWLKWPFS